MRIRTRLNFNTALYVISAVIIGVILAFAYRGINRVLATDALAEQMIEGVFDLSHLTREYVQTQRRRVIVQWRAKHRSLVELAEVSIVETRQDRESLSRIRKNLASIQGLFSQLIESYDRNLEEDTLSREWKVRLEAQMVGTSHELVAATKELNASSRRAMFLVHQKTSWFIFLTLFVLLGFVGISSYWIGRSISGPIEQLRKGAKIFADGDLEHHVEIQTHDEIGELAHAFNEMAADLQAIIHQYRTAEEELRLLNRDLEQRVMERTAELEESIKELGRSNAELEQFAYIASHDLQEPLRMVASYTQLLKDAYQDQLDEDANEFIGYAVDGARRMQALIGDLLAYSRVTREELEFNEVDCNAIMDNALKNLEAAIQDSHAKINCPELPTVSGDTTQLTQLFQNLVGNAVKYRGEEDPVVDISVAENGISWHFSVRDNGIGIDPQYQKKVFVIFQRLHRKNEFSGTGIGLSLCKRIVERHGGRIWVESASGEGSTFHFTLPVYGGGNA